MIHDLSFMQFGVGMILVFFAFGALALIADLWTRRK